MIHTENWILLIEDDRNDADIFAIACEESGIDEPIEVSLDGMDALERLRRMEAGALSLPRVIILDLQLPGLPGQELLVHIHDSELLRDVPVLVLTTSDDPVDRALSRRCGAADYLLKPERYEEMRALVARVAGYLA